MPDFLTSFPEWFSIPFASWINAFVDVLTDNAQVVFDGILVLLGWMLNPIQGVLVWSPWPLTIAVVAALAWVLRDWRVASATVAALLFLGGVGMWDQTMVTLALVLSATATSIVVGVPVGILMARSQPFHNLAKPVLDLMQTLPSLVYLVPVIMFMGIGPRPALIAVIIYAIPPVIRLTNLAIRNVPSETVEAGLAFGATPGQLLRKVQLPLGFPTLMAGVNQTIMMALAMVVIAAFIDGGGLGGEVMTALARLNVGLAATAGFAIVILAIIMDRISEGAADLAGRRRKPRGAPAAAEEADPAAVDPGPAPVAAGDPPAFSGPPEDAEPVVVLDEVSKIFGPNPKEAAKLLAEGVGKEEILARTRSTVGVSKVSLEIKRGETFVIMGLSGSGKSTLIRCLNRLIEPTDGRIEIDGQDVRGMSKDELIELRRSRLGMVFQRFALLPHRSVLDNVGFGLEIQGAGRDRRDEAGRRALDVVGLHGWADSLPSELSGGMQQRVGLARALATDPDLLLMDEPFSALDPLMRRQLQLELADLQVKMRKTIVFITHDLDEALRIGDRIAIMKDGEVVQVGTGEDILLRPADDYVEAFVEGHDKSDVLTARDVMFAAETRVRGSASPALALRAMERAGLSSLFVVDEGQRLVGLVTLDAVIDAGKTGVTRVEEIVEREVATTHPDEAMRNLIPVAVTERYPIAVVDDDGRFLGVVARVSILRGLALADDDIDDPAPVSEGSGV